MDSILEGLHACILQLCLVTASEQLEEAVTEQKRIFASFLYERRSPPLPSSRWGGGDRRGS